ncbi:MAG: hypothetical protein M1834_001748 [Cirrosporium novae-zelandiae]|nr:MAG: hypothetical protein M1834_001748 [Cirrosporium novae-zelandiae]
MAEMITARMRSAHSRFEKLLGAEDIKGKTVKISGSLQYPQAPIQSQKRWLLNYKARKDIAMNLVFNLVTQQYSVANTLTAKEAKADSSSMKAMAILTMVFPPGTSIASVFSLDFISSAKWTDYVAITLPLTNCHGDVYSESIKSKTAMYGEKRVWAH